MKKTEARKRINCELQEIEQILKNCVDDAGVRQQIMMHVHSISRLYVEAYETSHHDLIDAIKHLHRHAELVQEQADAVWMAIE